MCLRKETKDRPELKRSWYVRPKNRYNLNAHQAERLKELQHLNPKTPAAVACA